MNARQGRGSSDGRRRLGPDLAQYDHHRNALFCKSSQVNTLPNAKSQAKDKRAKDRQKYASLRCEVGVAPPGFEIRDFHIRRHTVAPGDLQSKGLRTAFQMKK